MNILILDDELINFVSLLTLIIMRTSLTLLFNLKKPKNYQSGCIPVYLRITVDGQRAEIAVSRKHDPLKWNAQIGRAAGTKADAKALNVYLEDIQSKIFELHRKMTEADELITAETLKNHYIGKQEKEKTLVTVFEEHNSKMKVLVGQEFERSTLQRYETALMHTKDL